MMRRDFVVSGGALAAWRSAQASSVTADVRVAIVGLRGRGRDHIAGFGTLPGVEIAALCDIDEAVLAHSAAVVKKLVGRAPALLTDYRKVLEDPSIHAVTIATPNHWHTLQAIWACQAGKDVYVEKPCSHTMFESRQIVAAARKYGRIVQHGTQNRSGSAIREGVAQLHAGAIGEVYLARALCFKWRDSIGCAAEEPAPKGVHYDAWVGPAPMRPYTRNRFHYNWHWQWNYGNGEIGNQAVHEIDLARWGLGVRYPTLISAMGGHVLFDDDQETPNALSAAFEFNEGGKRKLLEVEVRPWITHPDSGLTVGNLFYGSNGILRRDQGAYQISLGGERRPLPERSGADDHFANFIAAVRSRNPGQLNGGIEEGAITADLVHLANISYRLRRSLRFDPLALRCIGDEEANRLFTRSYRAPYTVPDHV
jgi:predicted dehydrogenase